MNRRLRDAARCCFGEGGEFTRDVGAGVGVRRRELPRERLEAVLAAHDEALRASDDPRVAKRARKAVVTRHGDLVVKENVPLGLVGRIKDRLAPGRHRAGYRNAHLLEVLGVSTARPYAWLRRDGRVFAVYADLSRSERLDHRARRLYGTQDRQAQARLRGAAAAWLGRLHRDGIYHGDLKGVNVLVRDRDGEPDFALIDTDRVRFFPREVDHRRRVKNLSQLAASIPVSVSRPERLRFFLRYAEGTSFGEDARRVAREVQAQLARKIVVRDEPIE